MLEPMGYKVICERDLDTPLQEVEENGTTFEENALIKAMAGYNLTGLPSIADDSGLQVNALDGRPGVYSARYCGVHGDDAANNKKLLENLEGKSDRSAYFECAIALVLPDGTEITSSGRAYGTILDKPEGYNGFGYDPLFYSNDLNKPFGIADEDEKNSVSHRGAALKELCTKLDSYKERKNA